MPVDEELQKLRVMCSEHGVDPKGSKTQLEDRFALSRIDEIAALHKTLYESWKQSPLTSAVRNFILDERSLCELIDPNEHSNYSVSPKVWLRIAESLVHVHGVDPNSGDEYGVTTLHELAHDANLGSWPCSDTPLKPKLRKMAQWLLDEGARSDIEMKARRPYFGINSEGNKDYPAGTTPAHIAEGPGVRSGELVSIRGAGLSLARCARCLRPIRSGERRKGGALLLRLYQPRRAKWSPQSSEHVVNPSYRVKSAIVACALNRRIHRGLKVVLPRYCRKVP